MKRTLPLFVLSLLAGAGLSQAADAYRWTVHYLIDNSRVVLGRSQKVSPRKGRGLAISPDGRYLYAGYNHSFNSSGEIRRISVEAKDFDRATLAIIPGPQGKAIDTDDKGRVYVADSSDVLVYSADLRTRYCSIATETCDGIAVTREGGELVMYASLREEGVLSRWVLSEQDAGVSGGELKGFDGSGKLELEGSDDLRGVEVDEKGRIWVADIGANRVYRVSPDGKEVKHVEIGTPMDIAIDRGRVLVTRYTARAIAVLDEELNLAGNLSVPWQELHLSPFGNNRLGGLAGIAALPGQGFFVANEGGQTADQKSTYGRQDDHSGDLRGSTFRDSFQDDNDPILLATEVSTSTP